MCIRRTVWLQPFVSSSASFCPHRLTDTCSKNQIKMYVVSRAYLFSVTVNRKRRKRIFRNFQLIFFLQWGFSTRKLDYRIQLWNPWRHSCSVTQTGMNNLRPSMNFVGWTQICYCFDVIVEICNRISGIKSISKVKDLLYCYFFSECQAKEHFKFFCFLVLPTWMAWGYRKCNVTSRSPLARRIAKFSTICNTISIRIRLTNLLVPRLQDDCTHFK